MEKHETLVDGTKVKTSFIVDNDEMDALLRKGMDLPDDFDGQFRMAVRSREGLTHLVFKHER